MATCPCVHRARHTGSQPCPTRAKVCRVDQAQAARTAPAGGTETAPYAALDETVLRAFAAGDGIVSYQTLRELGYSLAQVSALARKGTLVRLWHGRYANGAAVSDLDVGSRHLLVARAVLSGMPKHVLSHQSALLAWSLPVLERDVNVVHVCGVGLDRPRRAPGLWVHPSVDPALAAARAGVAVVAPALAVAQTAALVGPRAGLMAADAGLRSQLFSRSELSAAVAGLRRPRQAARVVDLASAASESAGESWCRLVFADLGLRQPLQQAEILDEHGRFVARVDFLFEKSRVVVEFDGAVKYAGADGREQLMAEKRREDALRRLGYRVIRLVWSDLADPERVARLLQPVRASV